MQTAKMITLSILAASVVPMIGVAQTTQETATPAYRPGLGDMMTATVQPRHIKLALAGREKNWAFAAYELHELEESFDSAGRIWPTWRNKPIADMIKSAAGEPMAAVNQAVKAADSDKFTIAYRQLTDACNICHQSAERGMVFIQVPESSPYPDQDFRPQKQ